MAPKKGSCRICNEIRVLEAHHIISRGHAIKSDQKELIINKGNIVYICRKCHNQTSASKSRFKIMMQDKEKRVETIEIEKLKDEIIRIKAENRDKIRTIRNLAKKEIDDVEELKDIEITIIELENEVLEEEKIELKDEIDVLNSLTLEHHISKEVSKTLKIVKRKMKKTKKDIRNEVKKTVKVVKKAGKKLRKRTGL
jgi:hypothetical protein